MLKFLKRFFDPSRMVSDDIVRGPIPSVKEAYGRMISLAWPSAVESVLICLTGSVDTMMVGTLGAAAISAVGITSQPRFLMMTPIIALNTGVTAVIPHGGNMFQDKCVAAAHVINGFGKSAGLLQVQELGTLETPVLMTNTLSVGTVTTALVEYMLEQNEDIGVSTGTVNSVVMECNDGHLNDIRGLHVTKEHARAAIEAAAETFEEGAVGVAL